MDASAYAGLILMGAIGLLMLWGAITGPERKRQQMAAFERARDVELRAREARAAQYRAEEKRLEEERERDLRVRQAAITAAKAAATERSEGARARAVDRAEVRARELLSAESALVSKFVEVTLRKVTLLDDYGEENWDALDDEIQRILGKLKKKYPEIAVSAEAEETRRKWWEEKRQRFLKSPSAQTAHGLREDYEPDIGAGLRGLLGALFRARYEEHARSRSADDDVAAVLKLSGEGYEAQLMNWLRALGVEDVRGTPRTGDQGADVIFTYRHHRVAVQCKRYRDKVSNKAVQEAHAAKSIYGCTDAWVVTTGIATQGARQAAQMTGVVLIEGATTRASIQQALATLATGADAPRRADNGGHSA